MRTLALLVVNAGSSSVKLAVFAYPPHGDPARRPLHESEAVETGNSVSIRFDAEPAGLAYRLWRARTRRPEG